MQKSQDFSGEKGYESEALNPAKEAFSVASAPPLPYLQLFQASTRRSKGYALLGCVAAVGVGIAFSLLGVMLGQSLDLLIGRDTDHSYREMCRLASVGVGLGAFALVMGFISAYCFNLTSQDVSDAYRMRYYQAILRKDEDYFDSNHRSKLAKRLEADCKHIAKGTGTSVMISIQLAAYCTVSAGIAAAISLQAALLGIGLLVFSLLGSALYSFIQAIEPQKRANAYSNARLISQESFKGIKAILACNGQNYVSQLYSEAIAQSSSLTCCLNGLKNTGWAIAWAGWGIAGALFFLISTQWISNNNANLLLRNHIEGPDIVTIWWLLGTLSLSPLAIIPGLKAAIQAKYAAGRIEKFAFQPEKTANGTLKWEFEGKVEFKNVTFAYPKAPNKVILSNLSLICQSGQRTAIIGESGSGKSTIAQLLLRFYETSYGVITIDGVPISEIHPSCLRNQIGYITCSPVLFNLSIEENIHMAAPNASSEEVETAAKEANAFAFIMALQDGFLTQVGGKGAKLTVSQRQRIAIARVAMKKCRILIVDEATAQMDSENEDIINQTISAFHERHRITTIMLSSRLRALKGSDRIVILQNGKAEEADFPDKLISINGAYAGLCAEQGLRSLCLPGESLEEIEVLKGDVEPGMLKREREEAGFVSDSQQLRVARMVLKEWPLVLCGVLLAVTAGVAILLTVYFTSKITIFIDNSEEKHTKSVEFLAVCLLIGAFTQAIALSLSRWLLDHAAHRSTQSLRQASFRHMLNCEAAFYDDPNRSEELSEHLERTIGTAYRLLSPFISAVCLCTVLYFGAIIAGLYLQWKLSIAYIVLIPVSLGFMRKWALRQSEFAAGSIKSAVLLAAESVMYSKLVSADQLQTSLQSLYEKSMQLSVFSSRKAALNDSLWFGIGCAAPFLSFGCINLLEGWLLTSGSSEQELAIMEIGYFIVTLSLAVTLFTVKNIWKGYEAAGKCLKVLDYPPAIDSDQIGGLIRAIKGHISFRSVGFNYPKGEKCVLQNVSFEAKSGKCIGIAGSSGAGKSTLLQLIMRFYDLREGVIAIDGVDIRHYDIACLRLSIAIVPQDPVLFSGTVRTNAALGLEKSDEDIRKALRQAAIPRFADTLDRDVGAAGVLLSKGQKQRLALARALLRSPAILLLDEATSALDSQTERQILETLNDTGKTIIITANSPKSLSNCDEILLLASGTLTARRNSPS